MCYKGMQGKIGEVQHKKGVLMEIHVYSNSSDFPSCQSIQLIPKTHNLIEIERVPITEEIWQKVGECLGYKFKRFSNSP